jgi:RHS repeat-associated protein
MARSKKGAPAFLPNIPPITIRSQIGFRSSLAAQNRLQENDMIVRPKKNPSHPPSLWSLPRLTAPTIRTKLLSLSCVIAVLLCAPPAAAQCNPSYDPQCGITSGDGPNVGFSPAGAAYSLEAPSKTVPVTIVFTDEDGLNGATLQVRLWRAGSSVLVPLSWSTNSDGVRGTATGNLELTAFGEYVLVAQVADKLGTVGSSRVTFSLTQADPGSPAVFNEFHHNDYRDTSAGAMTLAYPGWSYSSMGTPKTTGLMYSSELAKPTAFIQVEAYPRLSGTNPVLKAQSIRMEQWNNGASGTQPLLSGISEVFYKGLTAPQQRLGVAWWWGAGTYTGTISKAWGVVRTYRTSITDFSETRFPVRMLILNEANSRYGAGWIVAGIKRIYDRGADGALIHEGNGTLRVFALSCPTPTTCSYVTPDGDFSKLVKNFNGTWLRTYPDGSQVAFSAAGLMTSQSDNFGNTTTVEWQNTQDGTNTPVLSRIIDPVGLVTTFAYDSSWYLRSITSPGGRSVTLTRNSANTITEISGPANLRMTYDSRRLLTSYNVSFSTTDPGVTTDITYDRDLKLKTVTAPGVTLHNGLQARPQVIYRQLAEIVVPDQFWVPELHSFDKPADAVISENVYAEMTDAGGHTTKVAIGQYGNPTKIVDPLGTITTLKWTADGLLESSLSPTDGTNNIWDNNGNLLQSIVNGATVYEASYDPGGRPNFVTNGKSSSWYDYGSHGEVLRTWYGKRDDFNRTATRYEYNARYQLTATIDPKGLRTEWSYENNAWKNADYARAYRDDGSFLTTSFTYDLASRLRTTSNTLGETTTIEYDALDRLASVLDPLGRLMSYQYTGPYLTRVTDTAGKAYQFAYNALGWMTTETFPLPDGGSRTYGYDREGLLVSAKDRRGLVVTGSYDALHRPITRTADGTTTTRAYPDTLTHIVTNNESTVTIKALEGVRLPDSVSATLGGKRFEIKRVYDVGDAYRNLGFDLITWNGATEVSRNKLRYQPEFRPADVLLGMTYSLDDFSGRRSTIHVDTAGRPVQVTLPNGVTESRSFKNDGRLDATTFNASAVNQKLGGTYAWDHLNRLNTRTSILEDRYWAYSYDALGQVTSYGGYTNPSANCSGLACGVTTVRAETYAYDAAGNRTDRSGAVTPGTNRYTTFNGYSFTYDEEGNITRKYKTGYDQRFTWNSLGQLTAVTTNGATVSYGYDGLGRRVRRTEGGQPRYFLYDDDDLILEANASGEPLRMYAYWPGIDQPHSVRVTSGGTTATYYYTLEHPGHVTGLINEAGAVAGEYRYTPFGEIESSNDTTGQPLRYMAREIDTATGLYYVRARWYDPAMARFVSQDPIGLAGGMNTYAYAGNDPVNHRDPSGLYGGTGTDPIILDTVTVTCNRGYDPVCDASLASWLYRYFQGKGTMRTGGSEDALLDVHNESQAMGGRPIRGGTPLSTKPTIFEQGIAPGPNDQEMVEAGNARADAANADYQADLLACMKRTRDAANDLHVLNAAQFTAVWGLGTNYEKATERFTGTKRTLSVAFWRQHAVATFGFSLGVEIGTVGSDAICYFAPNL